MMMMMMVVMMIQLIFVTKMLLEIRKENEDGKT